jgi:hypothetical protein
MTLTERKSDDEQHQTKNEPARVDYRQGTANDRARYLICVRKTEGPQDHKDVWRDNNAKVDCCPQPCSE